MGLLLLFSDPYQQYIHKIQKKYIVFSFDICFISFELLHCFYFAKIDFEKLFFSTFSLRSILYLVIRTSNILKLYKITNNIGSFWIILIFEYNEKNLEKSAGRAETYFYMVEGQKS